MKRYLATVFLFVMLFSFTACSKPNVKKYVDNCWDKIGSSNVDNEIVYVINYTSVLNLCGYSEYNDSIIKAPDYGYAVLFTSPFSYYNCALCFLDDNGKLVAVYKYDDLRTMYYELSGKGETSEATDYAVTQLYIADLAGDIYAEDFDGTLEKDTWYIFS